jgi:hypothetical protein
MRKYYVEVPVVMKLMVGVVADSKEEAIEKIFNADVAIDVTDENDTFDYIEYEWDMYEKVVQGNVYYGGINDVYIKDEGEADDEE